jgi:hypothetical protein
MTFIGESREDKHVRRESKELSSKCHYRFLIETDVGFRDLESVSNAAALCARRLRMIAFTMNIVSRIMRMKVRRAF